MTDAVQTILPIEINARELALQNKQQVLHGLIFEQKAVSNATATLEHLDYPVEVVGESDAGLRVSLEGVKRYCRLSLPLSLDQTEGAAVQSVLRLVVRCNSGSALLELGARYRGQNEEAWHLSGAVTKVELSSSWMTISHSFNTPVVDGGQAETFLVLREDCQIDIAVLIQGTTSADWPDLVLVEEDENAITASALLRPVVQRIDDVSSATFYITHLPIAPAHQGGLRLVEDGETLSDVQVTEEGSSGVRLQVPRTGRDRRIFAELPGGYNSLIGEVFSASKLLQLCEATYVGGELNIRALFSAELSAFGEVPFVDLKAGERVLHRSRLTSGNEGERAKFSVPVSRRTLRQGVQLSMPSLGLSWPVQLETDAPTNGEGTAPTLIPYADRVEGSFEGLRVNASGTPVACGWLRDPARPDEAVVLDLFADGGPIATGYATSLRPDVAGKTGGSSVCGFSVELPPNFASGETLQLEVRPRAQVNEMSRDRRAVRFFPVGITDGAQSKALQLRQPATKVQAQQAGCAAIILTQDGAEVLAPMLESMVAYEAETFARVIVIDHESNDNTAEVVQRYVGNLPIELVVRPRTSSFSESNNYAAHLCSEDLLFFLNNDLIFTGGVCRQLAEQYTDCTGVLGLRLMDPASPHSRFGMQAPQHVGVHFNANASGGIRPFETRFVTDAFAANSRAIEVPAVTAALAVVDRAFFEEIGGFDESYFYGWEDVDLSLRAMARGRRNISFNSLSAVHVRGYSRRTMPDSLKARRAANPITFAKEWEYTLARSMLRDLLAEPGFWSGRKINVGFVVSEAGPSATAGDYMTALDFSRGFQRQFPSKIFFFDRREPVDAREIDVLFIMIDSFDVRNVKNLGRAALLVAWPRNWFHRWAARPWRERFDLWLASSRFSVEYLEGELGRAVGLLPIGTDLVRFQNSATDPELEADVVFTGHNWGVPRDIETALRPDGFSLKVFGEGWGTSALADYAHGPLPYERMPDVYAGCRIVVDDSNFATATWGSVNSRVFDAIAGGALVLTNNRIGSEECFEGKLPVYDSPESLQTLIHTYLQDEEKRSNLVAELRGMTVSCHSYEHRASAFGEVVRDRLKSGVRIAIKIGAPSVDRAESWGDWHFANALRRELENLGHSVRIDCLKDWQTPTNNRDDVNIVLRGLSAFNPSPNQINVLWIISHPHKVTVEELEKYDHVYVASASFTERLKFTTRTPVDYLPQCTEYRRKPLEPGIERKGLVFVANSRNIMRPVAAAAMASGTDIEVFGDGWKGLIPEHMVQDTYVPNEDLPERYGRAEVVLNDHWDDMRQGGFISNRMFDAVACGAVVLTDRVHGAEEVFGPMVKFFEDAESFRKELDEIRKNPPKEEDRVATAERITREHSFASRAKVLDTLIRGLNRDRDHLLAQHANLE